MFAHFSLPHLSIDLTRAFVFLHYSNANLIIDPLEFCYPGFEIVEQLSPNDSGFLLRFPHPYIVPVTLTLRESKHRLLESTRSFLVYSPFFPFNCRTLIYPSFRFRLWSNSPPTTPDPTRLPTPFSVFCRLSFRESEHRLLESVLSFLVYSLSSLQSANTPISIIQVSRSLSHSPPTTPGSRFPPSCPQSRPLPIWLLPTSPFRCALLQ